MALPVSGQLSLGDISNTFGPGAGTASDMAMYYRGGARVPLNVNFPYLSTNVWRVRAVNSMYAPAGFYTSASAGGGYYYFYYTFNPGGTATPYSQVSVDNWQPRNTMVPTSGQIAINQFYGSHDY